MAATITMEQATELRREQIESNRDLPVTEYKNREKQADAVYEVIDGYKYLPGKDGKQQVLGPGMRFHPTEKQVADGSLKGKARELTRSEYAGMKGGKVFAGADFKEMETRARSRTKDTPDA
jgi:hypothetical protein